MTPFAHSRASGGTNTGLPQKIIAYNIGFTSFAISATRILRSASFCSLLRLRPRNSISLITLGVFRFAKSAQDCSFLLSLDRIWNLELPRFGSTQTQISYPNPSLRVHQHTDCHCQNHSKFLR